MAALVAGGWKKLKTNGHDLAGGLLATLFVALVPLLVFSVTSLLGLDGDSFFNYDGFYDYIDLERRCWPSPFGSKR